MPTLNVKSAVKIAKDKVIELFGDENAKNINLEEVEFEYDTLQWKVTIGFSRPFSGETKNALALLSGVSDVEWRRAYKIITIDDLSGNVNSVKNRDVEHA